MVALAQIEILIVASYFFFLFPMHLMPENPPTLVVVTTADHLLPLFWNRFILRMVSSYPASEVPRCQTDPAARTQTVGEVIY